MPEPESRAPSWPMNATSEERAMRTMRGDAALLAHARRELGEHVAVGEAVDRLARAPSPNAGPTAITTSSGRSPRAAGPSSSTGASSRPAAAPSSRASIAYGSRCSRSQRSPSSR